MNDKPVDLVKNASTIVLISHIQPDGDAVGSLVGLAYSLTQIGKQVRIVCKDQLPDIFSFSYTDSLNVTEIFPAQNDYDACVILDVSDMNRTGYADNIKTAGKLGKILYVDHHPLGDIAKTNPHTIHDQESSSTAEIVYELIMRLGVKITPSIATPLLLGIYTDTGGFQYSNTTARTLEIASDLMKRGARLQLISSSLSHAKTLSHLKLLGIALARLQSACKPVPYSFSVITQNDLSDANGSTDDIHGIINDINTLPQSFFSLLVNEEEGGLIKGTLRSGNSGSYNVRNLAKILGGGGHPKAAGFTIPGRLVQAPDGHWQIVNLSKN